MPAGSLQIQVTVQLFSYFKELAGGSTFVQTLPAESTLADLLDALAGRFPKLEPMRKSMLMAVGVEYQRHSYVLRAGDEVSLFPPVQGG